MNWKLFEALGEVDGAFVEEAAPRKKRPLPWRQMGAAAAGLAVLVGGIALLPRLTDDFERRYAETRVETGPGGELLWVDDRERGEAAVLGTELAIAWPWADLTPAERFTTVILEGKTYVSRGKAIDRGFVGDQPLGDGVAYGWEFHQEEREHTLPCTVWPIAPFDAANRLVAVRLEGEEDFLVFREDADNPPANLGAMLEEFRPETTLVIDYFRRGENNFLSEKFTLPAEAQGKIWQMLARASDALPQEDLMNIDQNGISCAVSSPAMGIENRSLTVTEEGWLLTNFDDYGYHYFIGPALAGEIIAFAEEQAGEVWQEEAPMVLAGEIVEIGEDYLKIDDSLLMADPDEGMVFTVSAAHPHLARWLRNRMLAVGDQVIIRYDGLIYADNPTVVEGAYGLDRCIISAGGQVLIPE